MINKRSYGDESSYEVACKHPRHLEHNNEPAPYVDVFPFSDASQIFQTPDGEGQGICKFEDEGRSAAASDMATEVSNDTFKKLETGSSGRMPRDLGVNNSIVEANVRSESEAHLSLFPEFFGPANQLRDILHSDKICSSPVDYSSHNLVSVGRDHQAYVPDWGYEGSHTSGDPANLDSQLEHPLGDDEEKLMGTCVLSMPDLDASANSFCEDLGARDNCMCADSGSVRCVRQHVIDARQKLMEDLGHERFEELGFYEMGEVVADKWSEEEEHLFHDVVLSNPASLGKNFWHNLYVTFPSRAHKDVVSYYYNVFMLRRRAEQNRFDPLNTDSDDDELQKSDFGLVEDNQEPVVESPLDASVYNQDYHLPDPQEYIEDVDDIDGYDDGAGVGCKGINDNEGGDIDDGPVESHTGNSPGDCGRSAEFQLLCKTPDASRGDYDIQDDSCTSYEYQRDM
ncbi:AT-rich interactive domain-containing protein 1-like isoform X2 [Argentina anserina]|nr:AT-rich interactive domain-containing protein 1-like isoform X2 [Potentilla anserina]